VDIYINAQIFHSRNSLSQSNIDTNNVCPCANNINTKVKNSSNSTTLQNFTRVQKQVDIINYSTSGRTMYGNFNPFLGQSATEYMNTVLASRNTSSTNTSTSGQYTLNASINNELVGLVGIGNDLTETNPNIFIRCVIPPTRNCIKPLKNKF
jgi:hypothetical protein